jgi:hypothetical protein
MSQVDKVRLESAKNIQEPRCWREGGQQEGGAAVETRPAGRAGEASVGLPML